MQIQAVIFLFSILILYLYSVSGDTISDYCAQEICPKQGRHIRCNNNGDFSTNCTGQKYLENMTPYIPLILSEHNNYRNIIAGGGFRGYYPAAGMPVLKWDWDLANNADFNARKCAFGHDSCRSTSKNPYAGQNIYYTKSKNLNRTCEELIKEAIFLWFEESIYGDHNLIESFDKTEPQTGHFAVLVSDRQTDVGCSMLINLLDDVPIKRVIIFVCNYSTTNFKHRMVYKAGKPSSDCIKKNPKYQYLCDEKIKTNDF